MNKNNKAALIEKIYAYIHTFIFRFALIVSFLAIVLGVLDVCVMHNKINGMLFLNAAISAALISVVCLICDILKQNNFNNVIVIIIEFFFCYGAFIVVFSMNSSAIAESSFSSPMMSFIRLTFAYVIVYVIVYIFRIAAKALKQRLLINSSSYDKVFEDNDK